MNWIGGARNRMKFQNERKTQKDFFERRRLNLGNNSLLHKNQSRKRLSQDLIALQTVRNIHSAGRSSGAGQIAPIKAVDLDRFRSCTQQFKEVDIGPVSPTHNLPSKLQLMDCKGDNMNQATSTETSFELSKSSSINDQTSVCQNDAKDTWVKPNAQETWAKPNSQPFTFSKPQESYKKRSCDSNPNPFVTEDFPFTPLTKHEISKPKRHKDSHTHHRHHERAHSRKHKTKDGSKRFMYTSTPYDHVQDISFKNRAANQTMNLSMDISPIGVQNMGKIELGDSYWVPTSKDELHQTNKPYSIGASGDFDNNKHAKDLNNKSQIVRDNFQNHGPSYVNNKLDNGKTDRQPNLHPQGGKNDSDPCSSRSSGFSRSEDSFNRSDSQYQSGLSLFKHAHVKRPSAVSDKLSTLDKFRQQIATSPGDLNKTPSTTKDLYETPTKPLIPYKPNFQDFDEEFHFTPYKEMSFQVSQDIPISSTPRNNQRHSGSNYCTPVKVTNYSSQISAITPTKDIQPQLKPSTADLIQSTPKQPDIMTLYKEQKKTKSTEHLNQSHRFKQYSPKVADKFPSHLQTQNKMIAETITAQKKLRPKDKIVDKDPYKKPTSYQDMSDVLQEMHQMETEESILNKASQERREALDNTVIYQDETIEPTSVSFEADKFFESEQHEIMAEKLQEIPDNEIKTGTMKNETEPENIHKIDNKATTITVEYIAVPLNTTEEFSCSDLDVGKTENEVQFMDTSIGFDVNTFAEHFPPADEIDGQVLDKLDNSKQDNENSFDLKSSNSEGNVIDTSSSIPSINQDTNIEKDYAKVCLDECKSEQNDSCATVEKIEYVEDNFHDNRNDDDNHCTIDNTVSTYKVAHNMKREGDKNDNNTNNLSLSLDNDDLKEPVADFGMINSITDEQGTKADDCGMHQNKSNQAKINVKTSLDNIVPVASRALSHSGVKLDAQQSNEMKNEISNCPVNIVNGGSEAATPCGLQVYALQSNQMGTEIKSTPVNVVPAVSKASSSYSLTVQDPEVSSGINRGVQCSIKQSLVDRGTSPFIVNKEKEFVDIGVQCVQSFVNIGHLQCDTKLELKMQLQNTKENLSTEEITEHSKEE